MIGKLIWRNLWRNKRRTLITTSSVTFAVVLAVTTQALVKGTFGNLIDSVVGGYSGHVQVHATGYWDEPSLELLMSDDDALRATLQAIPGVTAVVPRLETFMLVSADTLTRGALVMGVDGALEQHLMKLDDRIVRGAPVRNGDHGVVLAEGLAHRLAVDVHDTIVLLGQGYHGSMAAGKYPVRGIARFGAPQLNDGLVYLPLPTAQELLSTPEMVTTWAFALDDPKWMEPVQAAVSAAIGLGTALVYPTFLAVLAAHTHPQQRSEAVGVFRLWRDLGYAIGALLTGLIADRFGITASILAIGGVTVLSGIVVWLRMPSERKCLEPADLKPLLGRPNVRVVDVRSAEEYASGHLPEAVNIPLPDLLERARSWSPKEQIITVCAKGGGRSAQAAQVLRDRGFGRTWWLCGGTVGWR